jgi:hypothetical protein
VEVNMGVSVEVEGEGEGNRKNLVEAKKDKKQRPEPKGYKEIKAFTQC